MRHAEDDRSPGESERNWSDGRDVDPIGPQGEALIIELQRLRHALDGERGARQHLHEIGRAHV